MLKYVGIVNPSMESPMVNQIVLVIVGVVGIRWLYRKGYLARLMNKFTADETDLHF